LMANSDLRLARKYHQLTKHSLQSLHNNRHYLDWVNEPLRYKLYPGLETIPLPKDLPETGASTLASLKQEIGNGEALPEFRELAYLLYYTAGITKKLVHAGGEIHFRAAASAGALYPIEIYLVCTDLPGLERGVYHFSPASFELHRLRKGDFRSYLVEAGAGEDSLKQAPVSLVFTGITWRTAWKYQARSYRYHFWDCGTMLANALAAASALSQPAKVLMSFVDGQVNRLVGIDGQQEKSLCLFPFGRVPVEDEPVLVSWKDLPELTLPVTSLSSSKVEYPIIEEIHAGSYLENAAEVSAWRAEPLSWGEAALKGRVYPLQALDEGEYPAKPLEDAILERGSSRRFKQESIHFSELSNLLLQAAAPFPACWLNASGDMLNDLYLSVHSVDGLPPGKYVYHRYERLLELLEAGEFRGEAAHLCLGQDLGGDASVTVFFLADLDAILERYGNRGYRLAQMEAGITGGNLYLSAYALGRGATGLTFFDDDVINYFSPHAAGMEAIFVVALGVPAPSESPMGRLVRILPGEPVNIGTQGGVA
jgi:SagB-type dehydrogenase family enzyme